MAGTSRTPKGHTIRVIGDVVFVYNRRGERRRFDPTDELSVEDILDQLISGYIPDPFGWNE